jgi:hypothetical protein
LLSAGAAATNAARAVNSRLVPVAVLEGPLTGPRSARTAGRGRRRRSRRSAGDATIRSASSDTAQGADRDRDGIGGERGDSRLAAVIEAAEAPGAGRVHS